MKKRKIIAVVENHFDQIWRRRFKGDVVDKGRNVVSYSKIEKYFIDENIRLAQMFDGYKFQIESPCAVETYIEGSPENKEIIKKLYADGVLKTTNTGYALIDSNMISPEAIIRNYLISDEFFAEYAGETPKIANRSDAFGNSAQLPQILRAFGAKYVTEISYNPYYDDEVWVGLDKSAICVKKHRTLGGGGGWYKYEVCPECKGFGEIRGQKCPACDGKGIDLPKTRAKWGKIRLVPTLSDSGVIRVGGEEIMPMEDTPERIAELSKENGVDISLGHWDYLLERYKTEIEKVESGELSGLSVRNSPEFNPNTTGGYITHIKIKQLLCDTENKLLCGDTLNAMRWVMGEKTFALGEAWRKFMLCAFHDSSAGTVVDAAYDEIMELFDSVDETAKENYLIESAGNSVRLFNPTAVTFNGVYKHSDGRIAVVRGLKPYSAETVNFERSPDVSYERPKTEEVLRETVLTGADDGESNTTAGDTFSIENEFFTVVADGNGICRITHKAHGILSDTVNGLRPCEWILQSDNGSPWATLEPPYMTLPLSERTRFLRIEKGEKYTRICYETKIKMQLTEMIGNSYVNWSLSLIDGYDRVRIDADVSWASFNKRLMLSLPIDVRGGRDIYGIPGGMLEREPYEPRYEWNGANGDYPAFRFGGVESENKSVAVFNRGTPAYRILHEESGKRLLVSVLRSPAYPVCLHEPISCESLPYDGMRDEGDHNFSFEIAAYGCDFKSSSVVRVTEQKHR